MAASLQAVLDHLRTVTIQEEADPHLLARFVARRDEAAFATLVQRHGPMVLSVCRRVIGSVQDAEDAFQATFLVLARKAAAIRKQESLGSWLHGVAFHLASKVRARDLRRRWHERQAASLRPRESGPEVAWRDLQEVLDGELQRLPQRYRTPLVLCYLEGQTHEEIARQLGCPLGTVRSRLARARDLLKRRLEGRGLPLSAGSLAVVLAVHTAKALPATVVESVCHTSLAGGAGAVTSQVAVLAESVLVPGALQRLAASVFLVVAVTAGVAGWAFRGAEEKEMAGPAPNIEQPAGVRQRIDAYGDPLPKDAIARLGTLRWRHEGEAHTLSFSANGKLLAAGSRDGLIIYDTATGKVVERLQTSRDGPKQVHAVAFSPDGKYLAYQLSDANVRLWDVVCRRHVRTLSAAATMPLDGMAMPIRFSPDGKLLAANHGDVKVVIWDVATGKVVSTLTGHKCDNPCLSFAPDGRTLVMAAVSPNIQLWDVRSGKFLRGFDPDKKPATAIAVSPDGKTVAAGVPHRIILSEITTGKEVTSLETMIDHYPCDLAFTPDGKTLLIAGEDGKVRVWDLVRRKEKFILDSRGWIGRSMAVSADGKTVAMGTTYNVIRLWDVTTGKERFPDLDGHDAPVQAVAYSPDGKLLVTGGDNRQVRLWDAASGRFLRQLGNASVGTVSFSPDGGRLVTSRRWYKHLRVWDVATAGELLSIPPEGASEVFSAAFARDGKTIVSVDWARDSPGSTRLHVWDSVSGKQLRSVSVAALQPECMALSADGKTAAVGSGSEVPLGLYDVEAGKMIRWLRGHEGVVVSVVFSPEGKVLASGGTDRTARLWEAATGKEIAALRGKGRSIAAVAFSPNGRILAAGEGGPESPFWDGKAPHAIHLWDAATGEQLACLEGHDSDVTALAFTPDGRRLVSGLSNGSVLIWDVASTATAPPLARSLGPADLDALWADLGREDTGKAQRAIWTLAAAPEQAVPFLRLRLPPAEKVDPQTIDRLLKDLDDDVFAKREAATSALRGLDIRAEPMLRKALEGKPSPEQQRRIESLLAALDAPAITLLRNLRAVRALEMCRTQAARRLLEELAKGAPEARLTREANEALKRLAAK